ncbi:AAA family ATPase [Neobacillus sp. OS1-32]|uniref:AAA family ATPase n=1 Tax=Neobacillus sp. OS1-32 TaxID=3070682 RepID=UPI0027DFA06C|nr:AAA family ATPase [Neobacillus sp. OS1-32]WML31456.1 AAA family ATPase [Neobacillus sp. OS1-32]
MKLIEITLQNFRQFYGVQKIEFASGNENITIIFGENGKGKTGIFRALMFGLYGSTHIQQDNPKEKIHLVNFLALEENPNMPVDTSVQLMFEHRGQKYVIKRLARGYKTGDVITEKIIGAELTVIDDNGNYSAEPITDETEIKTIINNILDESIKDFFLFDAEKIETLAKTDAKVKEEVKNGIVKLLQIDKLEAAINLLKKLYMAEKRRVLSSSKNLDLTNKQNEIDALTDEIVGMQERVQLKEDNKTSCAIEIERIENQLAENEGVKRIQEKLRVEKEKKALHVRLAKDKKNEIKGELVNNAFHLLMKDTYVSTKNYLDQILVDQKDLVPIEVIEKSLNDMVCACCGNDLHVHKENLHQLELLKNNFKRSELTPLISQIASSIHDFSLEEETIMKSIDCKLRDFREIKDEMEGINREIDKYSGEIQQKAQEQENLRQLEVTLNEKKAYLKALEDELRDLQFRIGENEKKKEALEKDFSRMLRENESLRIDSKILQYIETLKDHFERVFKEYSDEMRQKLTKETTEIFKVLIDRKDKELVKNVNINEKYEIDILNWDNIHITQDVSQGQRQVVALSFIASLAKVAAGGSSDIDFPLFMDTPFGRISGNNRDHLIDNIPNLTSQWVLLLTDTELSRTEEIRFKSTGKLGKWYKLEQIKPGHSEIVPLAITETMATRG